MDIDLFLELESCIYHELFLNREFLSEDSWGAGRGCRYDIEMQPIFGDDSWGAGEFVDFTLKCNQIFGDDSWHTHILQLLSCLRHSLHTITKDDGNNCRAIIVIKMTPIIEIIIYFKLQFKLLLDKMQW